MRNFFLYLYCIFSLIIADNAYSQNNNRIEGMDYVYALCFIKPDNDWPVEFCAIYPSNDTITINLENIHSCVEGIYENAYYSPRPSIDTPEYFYKIWGYSKEVEMQHTIFENEICKKVDKCGIKRKYRLKTGELLNIYLVRFFGLVIDEINEKEFDVPDGLNSEEFPRIKHSRIPISIISARRPDVNIVLIDEMGNVQ